MFKINYSPSLMCGDLNHLESTIRELEAIGMETIHLDVIDGSFSPSMPLGIDSIKKLRPLTKLKFDVHLMTTNNEFFIQELLAIGVEKITFHYETSLHIDRYIQLIHQAGVRVGIALNPATSLSVLDYIAPEVDSILLMLINPGFAGNKKEKQVSYATKKVKDLKDYLNHRHLDTTIQVDGRVSLETIPELIQAGAKDLVLGSTSLFIEGNSLSENKKKLDDVVKEGLGG